MRQQHAVARAWCLAQDREFVRAVMNAMEDILYGTTDHPGGQRNDHGYVPRDVAENEVGGDPGCDRDHKQDSQVTHQADEVLLFPSCQGSDRGQEQQGQH